MTIFGGLREMQSCDISATVCMSYRNTNTTSGAKPQVFPVIVSQHLVTSFKSSVNNARINHQFCHMIQCCVRPQSNLVAETKPAT